MFLSELNAKTKYIKGMFIMLFLAINHFHTTTLHLKFILCHPFETEIFLKKGN